MKDYSKELMELANQAWILNCALAELYRFRGCVEAQGAAEPSTAAGLEGPLGELLDPAIGRLTARLQALLAKWTRRMAEEAPGLEAVVLHGEPWGWRAEVPAAVRRRLQVAPETVMTLADAERLAAGRPDDFFTLRRPDSGGTETGEAAAEPVRVTAFSGVPLNVARIWWSWCHDVPWPRCRLRAITGNLWEIDACGGFD